MRHLERGITAIGTTRPIGSFGETPPTGRPGGALSTADRSMTIFGGLNDHLKASGSRTLDGDLK